MDGIAQRQTRASVEEGHAIEEGIGLLVAEHQPPARPPVVGSVDARGVPGSDRQDQRAPAAECLDVAELESGGSRRANAVPLSPRVESAQDRALTSAGPRDPLVHGIETAQLRSRPGGCEPPLELGLLA